MLKADHKFNKIEDLYRYNNLGRIEQIDGG